MSEVHADLEGRTEGDTSSSSNIEIPDGIKALLFKWGYDPEAARPVGDLRAAAKYIADSYNERQSDQDLLLMLRRNPGECVVANLTYREPIGENSYAMAIILRTDETWVIEIFENGSVGEKLEIGRSVLRKGATASGRDEQDHLKRKHIRVKFGDSPSAKVLRIYSPDPGMDMLYVPKKAN